MPEESTVGYPQGAGTTSDVGTLCHLRNGFGSSLGWVYDAVRFPLTKAKHNADFCIVRHAVSIDEGRAFFRQNLFGELPPGFLVDRRDVAEDCAHRDTTGTLGEFDSSESSSSPLDVTGFTCS